MVLHDRLAVLAREDSADDRDEEDEVKEKPQA